MTRRVLSILGIALLIVSVLGGCAGKEMKSGDFKYSVYGDKDSKYAEITGLTSEGMGKQVLIVPEEIGGYTVQAIQQRKVFLSSPKPWASDKLEALYLPNNLSIDEETLNDCPNIKKIFIMSLEEEDVYFSSNKAPSLELVRNPESNVKVFIFTYFYSKESISSKSNRISPANITYYYNYDRPPNEGCHWLDNLQDGEIITFIPEDPTRERYIFAGWYKEPECINKWDFEKDTVLAPEGEYYENKLYAKWD